MKASEAEKQRMRDYYQKNKEKYIERAKAWKEANPEKTKESRKAWRARATADGRRRATDIKMKYDLSWEDFTSMYDRQEGKCRICADFISLMNSDNTAHVDHCHTTGKVRGLLCAKCNKGLGCFQDDTAFLESAIKYLKESM